MALWGKSTTAESRPKFLPEDSNADGSSGAREHAIVQPGGWALKSGLAASGNDNTAADPEILVCISNLSNVFGNANILSIDFTAGEYADASDFTVTLTFDEEITVTSAAATSNQTITNKMYLLLDRLGGTDMASDNTIAAQYSSGSGTNQLSFVGRLQSAAAGYIGWSNTMVNFNGTAAAVDNDGHDIRTIRINSTDGSSDANDRIILNGTDGTSANAGDGLMAEQINIQLEGVDSATDVRSETKTGDDSEVVMLLEDATQETGSDKLVLNGTDGSSTNANDNVLVEDFTGQVACYTQTGSSTGSALVFNGVTTT
jgi:hypothetical protein